MFEWLKRLFSFFKKEKPVVEQTPARPAEPARPEFEDGTVPSPIPEQPAKSEFDERSSVLPKKPRTSKKKQN